MKPRRQHNLDASIVQGDRPNFSRKRPNRISVLVSGGVESAALIAHYLKRGKIVRPVYVRSGYRWERAELYWLRRLLASAQLRFTSLERLKPLVCLRSPVREFLPKSHWALTGHNVPRAHSSDDSVYLPGRNFQLISAAAIFCVQNDIGALALGILRGNPFPDASPAFFSHFERVLALGLGHSIRIATPFRNMSKKQVIGENEYIPWHLTFSCLSPVGRNPCGRCNKCEERRRALKKMAIAVK